MLLDIEEAEELPVASLFERRPDIDAEVQVNDGTQDRGARVENDDRVGKRRGRYGTKTSKERARSRVRERPHRKRLVGNRTEQRDRTRPWAINSTVTTMARPRWRSSRLLE